MYAMYNGALAQTYYFSSDGGRRPNPSTNVWNSASNLPLSDGVMDPYEATIEDQIPQYNWDGFLHKDRAGFHYQSKRV
jgi:peptidoglycan hydrolase-like amidase